MMDQEIAGAGLQIHMSSVVKVYSSGLCDAVSERGSRFKRIAGMNAGIESDHFVGQRVVVLSDGSQHFVVGEVRNVVSGPTGRPTIHNVNNDLFDLRDAKVMMVDDEYGHQVRIIASRGAGVIIDAGDWCLQNFAPGLDKLMQYFERLETVMPGHCANLDRQGDFCSSSYTWRTTADLEATRRDLRYEDLPELNFVANPLGGHTLNAKIETDPFTGNVVAIRLYRSVAGSASVLVSSINIKDDGAMEMETLSDLSVNALGNVDIVAATGVTVQSTAPVTVTSPNVVVDSPAVQLGSESAADPVVLESKLQTEIAAIKATFATHTHGYIAPPPVIPAAVPVPTTPPVPQMSATLPLGALKVKGE